MNVNTEEGTCRWMYRCIYTVCAAWPAAWGSAPQCWPSTCSPDSGCSRHPRRRSQYTETNTRKHRAQCLHSCGSHRVPFQPRGNKITSRHCSALNSAVKEEADFIITWECCFNLFCFVLTLKQMFHSEKSKTDNQTTGQTDFSLLTLGFRKLLNC